MNAQAGGTKAVNDFKFRDLPYERPDFDAVGSFAEQMEEQVKRAGSYAELKELMAEIQ